MEGGGRESIERVAAHVVAVAGLSVQAGLRVPMPCQVEADP